jgi:hypothetical protein
VKRELVRPFNVQNVLADVLFAGIYVGSGYETNNYTYIYGYNYHFTVCGSLKSLQKYL